MNTKTKKTFSIIGNTALWLFVIFAVIITAMVLSSANNENGLASFNGKSFIVIKTDSMKPAFEAGDMIVVKALVGSQKAECLVGDVITYRADLDGDGNKELNTHRITEVYEENGYVYYRTRGDNGDGDNNPDTVAPVDANPVVFSDIIGKWTGTSYCGVGNIIAFLQSSTGFLLVIVLPLLLFFVFELIRFVRALIKIKSKNGISAEEEEEIKKRAVEEYLRRQQQQQQQKEKSENNPETDSSDEGGN